MSSRILQKKSPVPGTTLKRPSATLTCLVLSLREQDVGVGVRPAQERRILAPARRRHARPPAQLKTAWCERHVLEQLALELIPEKTHGLSAY